MDVGRARTLAEAVEEELGKLSPTVMVDRENWDPFESRVIYVLFGLPDNEAHFGVHGSISMADALAQDDADADISMPAALLGAEGFLEVLAGRVDPLLARASVTLGVDTEDMISRLGKIDEPGELDALVLSLQVAVGRNDESGLDEPPQFQYFFPSDALGRIKDSIEWPQGEEES